MITVVVAGCERHIARLIQVNLERQGYEVFCAEDGQAAIDQVRLRGARMLLIDNPLPLTATDIESALNDDPGPGQVHIIGLNDKFKRNGDGPYLTPPRGPGDPPPTGFADSTLARVGRALRLRR